MIIIMKITVKRSPPSETGEKTQRQKRGKKKKKKKRETPSYIQENRKIVCIVLALSIWN